VFLDADDVIKPGYLERIDVALREHGLVAARMDNVTLNSGWIFRQTRAHARDDTKLYKRWRPAGWHDQLRGV
jgi:predicted O-methyltransferase YrrM